MWFADDVEKTENGLQILMYGLQLNTAKAKVMNKVLKLHNRMVIKHFIVKII